MNRLDIINNLIIKNNYKSYLEIGIRGGECFLGINCENKVGVDPDPASLSLLKTGAITIHETSDYFFETTIKHIKRPYTIIDDNGTHVIDIPLKFDIVFIDGLHHADQVEKDIENALAVLNEGGTIICHDMLPAHEFGTLIPMRPDHNEWWGNVYLTWIKLRQTRPDLEMIVCDTDHGTSLIRKGSQEVIKIDLPITFDNYMQNRKEWMNVLSADSFKQKYLD